MNTNQPAVYDPLTRTLHWLTVAGFIGIPTTIVLWTGFRRHFVWQD
ncbi:putative cytochrome B561 [Neisseria meningitidis]|nr:putative cytochrome B561 [Neisseria meningitidis]